MKNLFLVFTLTLFELAANGQEINKNLKHFKKITISPRINLVLRKGDQENIRLVYNNVSEDKINIEITGKTLSIFLDDARITEKTIWANPHQKKGIYEGVNITAYVTYKDIECLEIRGNQELTCLSPLSAEKFTLRAYGENEITLSSLKAAYFFTSLYGENNLKIQSGKAEFQKYRLFGENRIDTKELRSYSAIANIYGESKIQLSTNDALRVSAFGEPEVKYYGNPRLQKRLIIGEAQITKLD